MKLTYEVNQTFLRDVTFTFAIAYFDVNVFSWSRVYTERLRKRKRHHLRMGSLINSYLHQATSDAAFAWYTVGLVPILKQQKRHHFRTRIRYRSV